MSQELLSAELQATAEALRSVRNRLARFVAEGHLPEGSWSDLSTIQVCGLDVAEATPFDDPSQDTRSGCTLGSWCRKGRCPGVLTFPLLFSRERKK
jgi:hypothetical protein